MFQLHALEIASEAGITNFVASPTWQRRFKKTHHLSMRTRTRQGQISPEDAHARAEAFAAKVHAKMAELGVTVVHNADQTAVFFEYLPKKTMAPTGSKTVWVRCAGKDRQRCTVMLLADSTGRKFTQTVVLKTRPSKFMHVLVENIVERQGFGRFLWNRIKPIQDKTGLTIHTNSAGWWNEFLHREFLCTHFGDRGENPPPILLLLDEFSGHWTEPTMAYAASINVHLMRVPAGLTSVCQPADVSWMRPFKDYMRGEWISFLRDQVRGLVPGTKFKMKPPVYEDVCAWVRAAWDKVSQSTVQAGYRRTGIIHANDVIEHLEIDGQIGEVSEETEFDN